MSGHRHADPHTFDAARWKFHYAIVSLDREMTERGHRWIYSSDYREKTILVVNDRDHPDVPARWRSFPVRQVRMTTMSHRQFSSDRSGRSTTAPSSGDSRS